MGLFGSGSTWAFNVVTGLLRLANTERVMPLYADNLDEVVLRTIEQSARFVLKTHIPAPSVWALCYAGALPIVMTIRDPRDAVTSLMKRFGQDFKTALYRVERSANLALYFCERLNPLTLRYEDGFVGERGILSIAAHLGIVPSDSDARRLRDHLSRDAVARRLGELLKRGVLQGQNPAEEWEEGTQWHPCHVGDGRIGKYSEVLTAEESEAVLYATRPFCVGFGYGTRESHRSGFKSAETEAVSEEGWIDHFVPPDLISGWVCFRESNKQVEITARHEGKVVGQTLSELARPDSSRISDGYIGFQLRLSIPITFRELVNSVEICAICDGSKLGRIRPTSELAASAIKL